MAFKYTHEMFPVPPLQDPNDPASKVAPNFRLTNDNPGYLIYVQIGNTGGSGDCPRGRFVAKYLGRTPEGLVRFRILACTNSYKKLPLASNGEPRTDKFFGHTCTASRGQVALANPYYANPEVMRVQSGSSGYIGVSGHNLCETAWALIVATNSFIFRGRSALETRMRSWLDGERNRFYDDTGFSAGVYDDLKGRTVGRFQRTRKGSPLFNSSDRFFLEKTAKNWMIGNVATGQAIAAEISNMPKELSAAKANEIIRGAGTRKNGSRTYMYRGVERIGFVRASFFLSFVKDEISTRIVDTAQLLPCGHYYDESAGDTGRVKVVDAINDYNGDVVSQEMCASCFESARVTGRYVRAVTDYQGTVSWANRNSVRLYNAADIVADPLGGTVPFTAIRPEPVIGGYHSSRNYFTQPLPHITGHKVADKDVKIGFELEFVRSEKHTKPLEALAREMKKRLEPITNIVRGSGTGSHYAAFEYDGSVDYEMVTGYGPLDIHRAAVIELLGGAPFAGELTSHDGGRCGLHVHLDKPQSLLHATRMTAFYHAKKNKKLIKAISRRYENSRYALPMPDKMNDKYQVRNLWLDAKYGMSRRRILQERSTVFERAIRNINASNRYELLNFQPNRTVEVRGFRGSMIPGTVIACLEFAYMSYMFTRDSSDVSEKAFLSYISAPNHRHDSAYLRRYLHGKGFDVWMPRVPASVEANNTDETEAVR